MAVRAPGFSRAGADRRVKARDAVVDTALRLFAEHGYIGVRVEDIAAAAGISRATFYKYFSEREEILAELFARLLGRETVPPPPGEAVDTLPRIVDLLTGAAGRMVANERLARFVYALPIRHAALLGEGFRPPVIETVERMLREGAAAGTIRTDIPVELISAHVGRTFEAAMRDWATGRVDDAPAHAALLLDLAFAGVTTGEIAGAGAARAGTAGGGTAGGGTAAAGAGPAAPVGIDPAGGGPERGGPA